MARERLQKLMARAGLGSRRACEEIIREGRVMVNGRIATLGDGADLAVDKVHVDGVPLRLTEIPTTVALYKPMQTLSTDQPHRGDRRATARSLIPLETRLFAIGRLDADSEGLMLFTNDGDLAHRLSHPRFGHEKEYRVLVVGGPPKRS
jgi:23S rRNA pseudouridine2605 synthase